MKLVRVLILGLAALALLSCTELEDPLKRLERELARYPSYSVILYDMDRSGNFLHSYHHLYKIVIGEEVGAEMNFQTVNSDWFEVEQEFYRRYEPLLGMVVLSKGEQGEVARVPQPPGYRHVGNSRYGTWQNDSQGRSFWVFYGQYALMRDLIGSSTRPIYRDDYTSYRRSYDQKRPWFGSDGKTYGTQGTQTQKANPTFYQRQQARQSARSQSFGDKVKSRVGGSSKTSRSSMSTSRSRSSGRGGK